MASEDESFTLSPPPTHMKQFPPELLSLVFEMALVPDSPSNEYHEPVSVYRAVFSSALPEITLMNIGGVCSTWHSVATNTPSLWNRLHINHTWDIARVEARLERSKVVPLDVCVSLDGPCTVEYARRVARLLGNHIKRWRTFRWTCKLGLEFALDVMSGKEAPLLETLSLDDQSTIEDPDEGPEPYAGKVAPVSSWLASMPKLRIVELSQVAIPRCGHPLENLNSLSFRHIPLGTRPSLDQLLNLLRGCPQLKTLTIHRDPTDTNAAPLKTRESSVAPIFLPELKSLDLEEFHSSSAVTALLSFLHAPNLSFLGLVDFEALLPNDDDDLIPAFQHLITSAESFGHYRHLCALKLGSYYSIQLQEGRGRPVLEFLEKLTELRMLHIVMTDIWTESRENTGVLSALSEQTPVLCPHLETLKTSWLDSRFLWMVCRRRLKLGYPFKKLLYRAVEKEWAVGWEMQGLEVESFEE